MIGCKHPNGNLFVFRFYLTLLYTVVFVLTCYLREVGKWFWFKNPNIDIWVPKMRFSKMHIFGASIESEGAGMVAS